MADLHTMTVYTVSIQFLDKHEADWFARTAAASIRIRNRLEPCRAGILQDALSKAACTSMTQHEFPEERATEADGSIDYASWETEGGTTAEQNEARFSRDV